MTESALRRAVLRMREMGLLYREIAPYVGLSPRECRDVCHDELLHRRPGLFNTVTRVFPDGSAMVVSE